MKKATCHPGLARAPGLLRPGDHLSQCAAQHTQPKERLPLIDGQRACRAATTCGRDADELQQDAGRHALLCCAAARRQRPRRSGAHRPATPASRACQLPGDWIDIGASALPTTVVFGLRGSHDRDLRRCDEKVREGWRGVSTCRARRPPEHSAHERAAGRACQPPRWSGTLPTCWGVRRPDDLSTVQGCTPVFSSSRSTRR